MVNFTTLIRMTMLQKGKTVYLANGYKSLENIIGWQIREKQIIKEKPMAKT